MKRNGRTLNLLEEMDARVTTINAVIMTVKKITENRYKLGGFRSYKFESACRELYKLLREFYTIDAKIIKIKESGMEMILNEKEKCI